MKLFLAVALLLALPLSVVGYQYVQGAASVDLKDDWFAGGVGGDEPSGPWP